MLLLKIITALIINTMPHIEENVSGSPKNKTPKIVAVMGSIMPSADAMPTGMYFKDIV